MKAKEFVKQLAEMVPSRDALLEAGRSPEFVEMFIRSHECARRRHPLKIVGVPGSEDLIEPPGHL